MRNRSGLSGIASSPILVGAVTVLVVIVAVFLAYNANNGLPFVSTYNLKARVPNADALVKGNEVRIGGVRVGIVKKVVPIQLENGEFAAELSLSLDKSAEPLPIDSTMTVRPKSALGLKFLQVTPGNSKRGFKEGETIPVSAAHPEPVDIDQFFDMFDKRTRQAIRQNLAAAPRSTKRSGPCAASP
jgi:ABC-type transporter Mla subunit MlaD